jgi:cytochrome c-type biogenesis protein CcmH
MGSLVLFWIVSGSLAALVALAVLRPLLRPPAAGPERPGLAVYRDQLGEIERDVRRGVLDAAEAERARAEVGRRALALPDAPAASPGPAPLPVALAGGAVLVLGSLGLYAALGAPGAADAPRAARLLASEEARAARPSQSEAEAAAPPIEVDASPEDLALIEELRAVVPTRPDDPEGWRLLAAEEARLGRYAAAARAQERVVALGGGAEERRGLLDLMVAAAGGGFVSPEAEAVLLPLLAEAPEHPAALYYAGLLEAQVGRYDRAFPFWRRLVEGPDGFHRRLALPRVEAVARAAGVDYAPPADPEAEAIRGMVEGLASRLATEGGSAEEWARLVTSLTVLGQDEAAAEALAAGRAAHAGDAAALAVLAEAAP